MTREQTPAFSDFPLLPHGFVLFESLPMSAVVIEALAPAVQDGTLLVRGSDRAGLVLIRDGRILEAYAIERGTYERGEPALHRVQAWAEASVSAQRVEPALVELIPTLLSGAVCYDDLRLHWIDWAAFIDDLRGRPGTFVVEVESAAGRGVGVIRDGADVIAYTDAGAVSFALLEELATDRRGKVRVRVPGAAPASDLDDAMVHIFGRPQPVPSASDLAPHEQSRSDTAALARLAVELKSLARQRLHRSSDRVERLVDAALGQGDSLSSLLDAVRSTSIRGIVPARLEALAAEMQALAEPRARDQSFLPA
jgi:hypothetical protein